MQDEFGEVLLDARRVFTQLLLLSDIGDTDGTCLHASLLVRDMLRLCAPARADPVIRGGDGREDGGYRDADGVLRGHYWVEASSTIGARYVLDITADQFGGPATVAMSVANAHGIYVPGDQAVVDQHVHAEQNALQI